MTLNPHLFPTKGFRFIDEDKTEHVAQSLAQLADNLTKFRKRLGRPVGNPLREINDQICRRLPHYCHPTTDNVNHKALAAAVVANMTHVSRTHHAVVEAAEVAKRTEICQKCPLNVEWGKHCPPCLSKLRDVLNRVAKPEKSLEGRACLHALDDLSVVVNLENPAKVVAAPDTCWRRAT